VNCHKYWVDKSNWNSIWTRINLFVYYRYLRRKVLCQIYFLHVVVSVSIIRFKLYHWILKYVLLISKVISFSSTYLRCVNRIYLTNCWSQSTLSTWWWSISSLWVVWSSWITTRAMDHALSFLLFILLYEVVSKHSWIRIIIGSHWSLKWVFSTWLGGILYLFKVYKVIFRMAISEVLAFYFIWRCAWRLRLSIL